MPIPEMESSGLGRRVVFVVLPTAAGRWEELGPSGDFQEFRKDDSKAAAKSLNQEWLLGAHEYRL